MHQNFYTQDLHTMKNFEIEFLLELLAIHATPAPCLTRLSIEAHAEERRNLANMCLPKKKIRKRTNDSNKRGDYWKFDEFSIQTRDLVIESHARKVIAHVAANNGSCKRGFVKNLVDMAMSVRWNDTKNRASPRCSPNNSDNEEEEDVDDEEGGEMGTTGLVFGNDKSEDESDN
jgi:hypothetical protein